MTRPELCFVVIPYGWRTDQGGAPVDFDAIYGEVLRPAILDAGLEPLRADEEATDGAGERATLERLLLARFAVVDLTTASADVLHQLGVRDAVRPASTVPILAERGRPPLEGELRRAVPYALAPGGAPADPAAFRARVAERLREARATAVPPLGAPLFELLDGEPDVASDRTDLFRELVPYAAEQKERLRAARAAGPAAVREAERALGPLDGVEAGVVVDLLLSYRAVSAWEELARLAEAMPRVLRDTALVREQYALALNRLGRDDEAERALRELIDRRGPSSETCGLLGRVYKDRWQRAAAAGDDAGARAHLARAIDTYVQGFEADWTDAYPGVNAVTLMELREPPDPRQAQLLPVVRYGAERRIATGAADYWDHATRLELAVLARDRAAADEALGTAVAAAREGWEAESTAGNVRLVREARERRGEDVGWIRRLEDALLRRARPAHP